jgi:hypothetical protein
MNVVLLILDTQPPDLIGGYDDFLLEMAAYLGYGDEPNLWTTLQEAELDRGVQEAYRYVLYPSRLPGQNMPHVWSFLRRVTSLTTASPVDVVTNGAFDADTDWTKGAGWTIGSGVATAAAVSGTLLQPATPPLTVGETYTVVFTVSSVTAGGVRVKVGTNYGTTRTTTGTFTESLTADDTQISFSDSGGAFSGTIDDVSATTQEQNTYTMPADFGSMHSRHMTYAPETGWVPVERTTVQHIRERNQWSQYSEHPWMFALKWAAQTSGMNQRQEVVFYPTPDTAYTLSYEYAVLTNKLSKRNPYPLGGPRITQLMTEACKAVGEAKKNGKRGDQWVIFREQLADAIAMDASTLTDRTVGVMQGQYNEYDELGRVPYSVRSLSGSTYSGV